jgi:hypothetical protein
LPAAACAPAMRAKLRRSMMVGLSMRGRRCAGQFYCSWDPYMHVVQP